MGTYFVYFHQVNQSRYEVDAESKEEAIKKAQTLWRQEFSYPDLSSVEVKEE